MPTPRKRMLAEKFRADQLEQYVKELELQVNELTGRLFEKVGEITLWKHLMKRVLAEVPPECFKLNPVYADAQTAVNTGQPPKIKIEIENIGA